MNTKENALKQGILIRLMVDTNSYGGHVETISSAYVYNCSVISIPEHSVICVSMYLNDFVFINFSRNFHLLIVPVQVLTQTNEH